MDMEMELFSNVVSEEDTVEVDAENDNFGVEGERCGICMDIVVDRGLLDCCQHWFCFVCIDNWATITNLCPLCQNEFQLITCVPVYDTIGSTKTDEGSDSRDDDWCVEGNNSTLSFPSYYIEENAVTCLDGDGCKIRSGSVTFEEALTLDTSIACDSCDTWYHAFCVGFDPEGTGVDSWFCPRCLVTEAQPQLDFKEMSDTTNQLHLENGDHHSFTDTFSGKVSISVADAGETAVVISRIDGEDVVKDPIKKCLPTLEDSNDCETGLSMLGHDSCLSKSKLLDQGIDFFQPEPTISAKLEVCVVKSEPFDSESGTSLDLGLSLASTACGDDKANFLLGGEECLHDASARNFDENLEDTKADLALKLGEKRKRTESSVHTSDEDGHHEIGVMCSSSTRKVKAQRRVPRTSQNKHADVVASVDFQKNTSGRESSVDKIRGNVMAKKSPSVDIMSIVRGTEPRKANGSLRPKEVDKCAKVQKDAARLRVKKIMRRPSDDKESADVVQKLRSEIREAVHKKPSDDTGKSMFDPNLLAAFRAAVAGSAAEPAKKAPPPNVKAKKLMFQKGKARENLTKKIYSTTNGKRRRAWDRECEVEFWKHRCTTTSKPEKIATLKSVLNLLRKGPETNILEQKTKEEAKAPILSRLYLADASLFPRKDDIKPLSVLKAAAASSQNKVLSGDKDSKLSSDDCAENSEGNVPSAQDKRNKSSTCIKNVMVSGNLHSGRNSDKSSPQNKMTTKSEDVKIDKRKWALEVLARKKASSASPMHQKEDNAVLKGNYPLLAELPTDMRPKLVPVRHNKIPASARQAQLYRLTEHFLKMANLSSIRQTATTELAVADAVNIEKQLAERSNSKVVYLNLCSQEIRRHTSCSSSCTPAETVSSSPLRLPAEGEHSSKPSLDSETEAALRTAGLLSDSPPSSPVHKVEDLSVGGRPLAEEKEEDMENILEMDSHPDLDIYGDFEYDLDEEDYIGITATNASTKHAEDGESKVKVVFSTLSLNKTDNSEAKEQDLPSTLSLLGCLNDASSEKSPMEDKVDAVLLPGDASPGGEDDELSLAECEELYGPDKEPLITKLPMLSVAENLSGQSANNLDIRNSDLVVGETSSSCSQAVENTQDEKNTDPKVDKKSDHTDSVLKKVEAYIKEHIRPLCKSGVITADQYRWAVGKTTDKVMKHHSKSKSANFLIKEGDKVKKLAEQYVEAAKHKESK